METLLIQLRSVGIALILFFGFFVFTSPVLAKEERQSRAISMSVGLSVANINYEEMPVGAETHTEDGNLPGISIAFREELERLYGEMVINYHRGKVDYSGQAQDTLGNYLGFINTETETELVDLDYRVGGYANRQMEMYAGIGYRYWRREINAASLPDGSPVEGLLQRFTWFYGLLGVKYHFMTKPGLGMAVNLQARRMINPKVSAKNSVVSASLELKETWGYQLSFPVTIKLRSPYAMTIEPFAKRWQIDLTSDGTNVLPDNESNTYGINFIMSW